MENNKPPYSRKTPQDRIAGTLRDISTGAGKRPPQAPDLEEAVLGALMLEKDALITVIDILQPESFYTEKHAKIYNAIRTLFQKSEPIDILTVTNQLRSDGELEFAGGAFYITELTNKVNSAANIEFHARIIVEMAIKRELIRISGEVSRDAFEDTTDVFQLLDRTEQSFFQVSELNIKKKVSDMRSVLAEALEELKAKKDLGDGLTGVPSGFTKLDRITAGWQKSDLVILAARPGMGKCLGKGTKIVMFDGTIKNVEEVNVGDLLMGDDSTPRKVLSLARGQEMMYWIKQNKGISYRVNESHILSLKRSRAEGKHKKGDVLNISVKEYITKADKFQSSYKGYKVSVEFNPQETTVEPYFLGLWLGDGHSYSSRITNIDEEVIHYLESYADSLELILKTYTQENRTTNYAITKGQQGKQHFFSLQGELQKLDLLENKHIPHNYLVNSTENRLQLLAGLIDSDGSYLDYACGYEITQKNKKLAEQIKFLCDSLGFRTSFASKKVSIKSKNYETDVYRVRLYGDVAKIPTKIARKKARNWASRVSWQHTGIKVEADKVDEYYGFEIDSNKLFLLEDMTVTHNTAFVVSAARNAAVQFKKGVAIFSLEMSAIQLVNRLISAEAELESEKIKKGNLAEHEWVQLHQRISALESAPIFIDDTPALSVLELRAKCRRLKAQHDIQMIIIDYLQLMSGDSGSGKSNGNREQEIGYISRSLKNLAKDLNVPVIALSQLSRAVETRGGDKRPQLSDLRESGSIEQDADMVVFLYRPEYYGITQDENNNPVTGVGEVIIAKHRNGSLDSVYLRFEGKYTKFTDLEEDQFKAFSAGTFVSKLPVAETAIPAEFDVPSPQTKTFGSKLNQKKTPDFSKPENEAPPF